PAVVFPDVEREIDRPLQTNTAQFYPGRTVDVIIIGGGYTGLSAALHLAQSSNYKVVVLEAGRIGSGPSGKSMGHVVGLQAEEPAILAHCGAGLGSRLIEAGERGTALVKSLIEKHGIKCDVRDEGYLYIDKKGRQRVERDGTIAIDSYPYILGLAEVARRNGVEIYENTRATKLEDG